MSDILIRGIDRRALTRLKARAKRNGRSLQSEAKTILEQSAGYSLAEALGAARRVRARLKGRRLGDSAALVREDRAR
jgi:hypothetical protein